MEKFDPEILKNLYLPPPSSHKGDNGRLLLIGGSHLFHAASLWALQIASRMVDMVFYASVPENNDIVQNAKQEFRNGIVIPRNEIESYTQEADCILIGPGMERTEIESEILDDKSKILNLNQINTLENEGEQTYYLTKYLIEKFPNKKWVIDAGALQMMELEWLEKLNGNVIITPHQQEFERVFKTKPTQENVVAMAKKYNCIILLKGPIDIVCSSTQSYEISGGNAGMTKGGTGDVLAGLVAGLACTNDLFLAAVAGSYFNKKAGDALYKKVGPFFNSSDLANEIPFVMKDALGL